MDTDRFIELLAEALAMPGRRARAELIRARVAEDDTLREALELIAERGAEDKFCEPRESAEALLERLDEDDRITLRGGGALRAFNLMRDLGLWSKHEPTWLRRYRIKPEHAEEIIKEARRLAQAPWEPERWRRDLSATLCVTIDDASSGDLDDALSCVPREEGGWEFGVHIADPSAHVKRGTPLDEAARERGTSIYLPSGKLPMFPRELSEGAMSLVAGELRAAMTTLIVFDRDLNVLDVEVFPSTLRVDRRLSYELVDQILERDAADPIDVALHEMNFLTSELYRRRLDDGAVSFDIPKAEIDVTAIEGDPQVMISLTEEESASRALVAEAMILAGASMARFCARHQIPVIYRAQEAPEEELFDEEVLAMPEGLPRFFAIRRKMKRGAITTDPQPHFGLGLEMYVQATSPIRRYSDLIAQRQVKAHLLGEELPYSSDEILELAAQVESASGQAARATREAKRYWTYHELSGRIGEQFKAIVLNHRDDRIAYVFLHELALSTSCLMSRRHDPGAEVEVKIERASARRQMLRLKEA